MALDIHDRVNYSVTDCHLEFDEQHTSIRLILTVDTELGSVMEYLEIFMKRMLLCPEGGAGAGTDVPSGDQRAAACIIIIFLPGCQIDAGQF